MKHTIKNLFENAIIECENDKDGINIYQKLLEISKEQIVENRQELIKLLSRWIRLADSFYTHLGLAISKNLKLHELKDDVIYLQNHLDSVEGKSTRMVFDDLSKKAIESFSSKT